MYVKFIYLTNEKLFIMDLGKLSIGALIGGIVYFLLGWLVYGILLLDVLPPSGDPDSMNMVLMALSCLFWGLLLAWLIQKNGISTWQTGATFGAIVGALTSLTVGFGMAATSPTSTVNSAVIDALANAFCSGLTGAAIGWYFGRK